MREKNLSNQTMKCDLAIVSSRLTVLEKTISGAKLLSMAAPLKIAKKGFANGSKQDSLPTWFGPSWLVKVEDATLGEQDQIKGELHA